MPIHPHVQHKFAFDVHLLTQTNNDISKHIFVSGFNTTHIYTLKPAYEQHPPPPPPTHTHNTALAQHCNNQHAPSLFGNSETWCPKWSTWDIFFPHQTPASLKIVHTPQVVFIKTSSKQCFFRQADRPNYIFSGTCLTFLQICARSMNVEDL